MSTVGQFHTWLAASCPFILPAIISSINDTVAVVQKETNTKTLLAAITFSIGSSKEVVLTTSYTAYICVHYYICHYVAVKNLFSTQPKVVAFQPEWMILNSRGTNKPATISLLPLALGASKPSVHWCVMLNRYWIMIWLPGSSIEDQQTPQCLKMADVKKTKWWSGW